MKLGFVSSILDGFTLEEVIDTASNMGYECVEVACWPRGNAERRYAGVTHIAVDDLSTQRMQDIQNYCKEKKVEISSLAYYPNVLDNDLQKREEAVEHLKKLIIKSSELGVGMVTTFIGRNQFLNVEDNLKLVQEVWPDIIKLAEEYQVRIGIENCPMLFGKEQWPGGQNLMTTPDIWEKVFDILPSDYLGINYDPSHFVWQMIDYIDPLYKFAGKIFHVHFKDIKLYLDKLKRVGTMAYPLEYMAPKLPGLGNVDWGKFISALTDIGYDSWACIEVEDRAFENSRERILESLYISKNYISQFGLGTKEIK